MSRHIGLAVVFVCAVMATTGVALGGRIFPWEFFVWVWSTVVWAFSHWLLRGRVDVDS